MSAAGDKYLDLRPLPLRVLVVDDSSFFRSRISRLLAADPAFDVIGFAVNGREAVSMAARLAPDVILMDVEMPVMDGITAARRIMQNRPTTILMLSALRRAGAEAPSRALDAGAIGFIAKEEPGTGAPTRAFGERLIARIKAVGRNGARLRPNVLPAPRAPEGQGAERTDATMRVAVVTRAEPALADQLP